MTIQRMTELLAFERKCVESASECDRNCAECNLVQDTNELLDMYNEVISLLKAQEPVKPVKVNRYIDTDENGHWYVPETYDCGNCGVELYGKANYCHLCGRAVKWDYK